MFHLPTAAPLFVLLAVGMLVSPKRRSLVDLTLRPPQAARPGGRSSVVVATGTAAASACSGRDSSYHGTMASTVSILRAKNGRERLENSQKGEHAHDAGDQEDRSRMKGGPTPNHEVPDAELAGVPEAVERRGEHPGQDGRAGQRKDEQHQHALPALEQVMAIERRTA